MADPTHWIATDPDVLWSPGNVSEAIPGVSTALNWSFIDDAIELAARRAFCSMGLLRRDEIRLNRTAEERFMVCFFGRTVANIEAMRMIGDRMPGATANGIEEQLFGVVRPDAVNHDTLARVPMVLARLPRASLGLLPVQRRFRADLVEWWRGCVIDPPEGLRAGRALLGEARARYGRAFELGTLTSMLSQALYDQIEGLARTAGIDGIQQRLVTGYAGMLETGLLRDLWATAHAEMSVDSMLLRHGYHGPDEGQIASRVWREAPEPLLSLIERYAARDPDGHPGRSEGRQQAVRAEAEAELLSALPRLRRPGAKLVLRMARALIPNREVGKANYTQALDGARVAARRIGAELAGQRLIDDPEDVFHLTYDELISGGAGGLGPRISERRAIREDYLTTDLEAKWTGPPVRVPLGGEEEARPAGVVEGEGVGGGSVIGRVRVVAGPSEELLEGEILVCHSTDPGWVPLFHLAAGIAVDMGGQISHGAIVARELGLPCVTTTGDGTRRLKTGELVRLDGDAGVIERIDEHGERDLREGVTIRAKERSR
jgi:phosphohistidine swiveling domain-containing protein